MVRNGRSEDGSGMAGIVAGRCEGHIRARPPGPTRSAQPAASDAKAASTTIAPRMSPTSPPAMRFIT